MAFRQPHFIHTSWFCNLLFIKKLHSAAKGAIPPKIIELVRGRLVGLVKVVAVRNKTESDFHYIPDGIVHTSGYKFTKLCFAI